MCGNCKVRHCNSICPQKQEAERQQLREQKESQIRNTMNDAVDRETNEQIEMDKDLSQKQDYYSDQIAQCLKNEDVSRLEALISEYKTYTTSQIRWNETRFENKRKWLNEWREWASKNGIHQYGVEQTDRVFNHYSTYTNRLKNGIANNISRFNGQLQLCRRNRAERIERERRIQIDSFKSQVVAEFNSFIKTNDIQVENMRMLNGQTESKIDEIFNDIDENFHGKHEIREFIQTINREHYAKYNLLIEELNKGFNQIFNENLEKIEHSTIEVAQAIWKKVDMRKSYHHLNNRLIHEYSENTEKFITELQTVVTPMKTREECRKVYRVS